jgi:hypothetical protein
MSLNTILATTPLTSTNYVLKATGTTIGNSIIYDNGTNVGIGNTNTSFTLDVSGTGRFTGIVTFGSTLSNGTYAYTLPSATGTLALTSAIPANPVGGTGTTNYISKFTGASTIGNSIITDNGTNVGIGNTNTSYTLDVSGSLRNTTSAYFATASGTVGIGTTSATSPLSIFYPSTSADVNYIKMEMPSWGGSTNFKKNIIWHDSGAIVGAIGMSFASSQTYMDFHSFYNSAHTTTTLMRIQGNGNVGIGTVTPARKLTVVGTIAAILSDANDVQCALSATATAVNIAATYGTTGSYLPLTFSTGSDERIKITAGGTIQTLNGATLYGEIYQSSTAMVINGYAGQLNLQTSGTERMRITSGGNVLIGTTTDAGQKLQVNGTTISSNYRTINNGATIPGSGTATILTLSNSATGVYIVNANFGGQGNQIYGGMLIIVANAGSFRIVTNGSGSSCSLTLSGNNVQITNPIGAALDATANAILIANT